MIIQGPTPANVIGQAAQLANVAQPLVLRLEYHAVAHVITVSYGLAGGDRVAIAPAGPVLQNAFANIIVAVIAADQGWAANSVTVVQL